MSYCLKLGELVVYYNITAQRSTPTKNVILKHVVQNIVDYFFVSAFSLMFSVLFVTF